MDLFKLLGIGKRGGEPSEELGLLFAGIERLMSGRPDDEVRLITAHAGLLGKVAYADLEVTGDEEARIRTLLAEELSLSPALCEVVVDLMGSQQARLFSVEDYVYVRLINELCDRPAKLALLRAMFAVAAADGVVTGDEDAVIRNVSRELQLTHKEFIEARSTVRQRLSWLADGPVEP